VKRFSCFIAVLFPFYFGYVSIVQTLLHGQFMLKQQNIVAQVSMSSIANACFKYF